MDNLDDLESQENFTVEITDLDEADGRKKQQSWWSMPLRQRWLSLTATILLFVLIMALLGNNISGGRGLLGSFLTRPQGTSTPGTSDSMGIYLRGNPTWGQFTLDGKALASTPVIGLDRPLLLARGLHTLIWQAEPFKAKTCVFTVVDATNARGPCFSTSEITASFEPGAEAMVIAFFASLNDLSTNQRATLTTQLQATLHQYNSTTQVQKGELYAISESTAQANPALCRPFQGLALCYARADQPMKATLSLQMDNLTTSDDPCVTSNQCNSDRQDCRALCEDPVVNYGQQGITGWSVDAVVGLLWTYYTQNGRLLSSEQPNTAIRGAQTYRLVSVRLERIPGDSAAQGSWQITPFPTYGSVSDNPICAQATSDTTGVLAASFDNNSNIYVRQSFSNLTQMALGCLIVAAPADPVPGSTPTPSPTTGTIQPASFLLRFGVLLAVNASARQLCPDLPAADKAEQAIANQLQKLSPAA